MKFAAFVLLVAIAGINAMPQAEVGDLAPPQDRFIDDWILDAIRRITATIRLLGLDPLKVPYQRFDRTISPGVLQLQGFIENLEFTGLSDISVNNLYYNILFGRLDLDLSLPKLSASVENSAIDAVIAGYVINLGKLSGSLEITNIRVVGNILFIVQIGHISIYNLNLDFSIENIEADLTVIGDGGNDISDRVNLFINQNIPAFLGQYRGEISTLLGEAIRWIVNVGWPRVA